ncbi:mechanosensitive ion channel family protein [Chondrinema litorale]|uniref:mechanosensitive ion channel family protein n=1 Tax=Chondrinema litorale TaxID=2994555 RepID=UPI0025434F5F|nr:mechanosensitive ion channel family protein [Chondrinema litorale]UZR98883.1 mechanosensitive ion channel family protein [Chondrinema litorale]
MNSIDIASFVSIISDKLEGWIETIIAMAPNFLLAVVVIVLFGFISKFVKKQTLKLLSRTHLGYSLISLVAQVISIIVICVGVFVALGILELDKTVTSLLAGAGIIGLALGFAFQDLTANFLSGIFIAIQRPISIGDVVETNGFFGKVKSINIRSVIIDNFGGQEIEIPSKDIFQNPIMNYSKTGERRMQLNCGVEYDQDLQVAQDVAHEAISSLPFLQEGKAVEVHFDGFGDSSINFKIWYWINQDQAGPPYAGSEAIKALKKAFDNAGIGIPFPIRTLELKDRKEILEPFYKKEPALQNGNSNTNGSDHHVSGKHSNGNSHDS